MQALKLTIMERGPEYPVLVRKLLEEFQQQSGIQVEIEINSAWAQFTQYAFNRRGPDVSEVGTTRTSSLVAMDALYLFTAHEIAPAVRQEDFPPAAWDSCRQMGAPGLWGVPYMGESYVIQYRKDILRQAGIDEATAFSSFTNLEETLAHLRDAGVDVPMELRVHTSRYQLLHCLAAWVWSNGGDYFSPDGKQLLVDQPEVLSAIGQYMGMLRYASPAGRRALLETGEGQGLFLQGKAAVAVDNFHWQNEPGQVAPGLLANWGTAVLPGEHFTGGSNLVVWKYCRNEKAAVALVQFLARHESALRLTGGYSRLSQRLSVLNSPAILSDPHLWVMGKSIRTGRTYPHGVLWSVIGDRLSVTLRQIGAEILTDPETPLEEIVSQHMVALKRKLNLAFSK